MRTLKNQCCFVLPCGFVATLEATNTDPKSVDKTLFYVIT